MTNYSDIKGYRVKYISSDPTLNTSTEGQVWYNSTEGVNKSLVKIKAWSSGGNLNTARGYGIGSAGIATAALAFAGETYPGPIVNVTEEYSGYIWTNASNYPQTVWGVGGFGTQTAAVGYAGVQTASPTTPTNTNEYDGSTWTAGGAVNQHVRYGASAGILTAGLKSSGGVPPATNNTEEYNGTSWTTVNSSNTSAEGRVSAGTQTASIFSGGSPETSIGASVESYDGTSWTSLNDAPFPAAYRRGGGTQTHAVFAGGRNPADSPIYLNSSQEFDGITFINTPNMATTRWNGGGSGTDASSNTLLFGGVSAPGAGNVSATEEYNSSINSITQASWASGGNYPGSYYGVGSANKSTLTAGLSFGGVQTGGTSPTSSTNEYNGSTWTAGGNYPISIHYHGSAGTQTAGLGFGGDLNPGVSTTTAEYDGSTWTAGGALPSGKSSLSQGAGTQTAALGAGGNNPTTPSLDTSEEYNGSTWSAGGTMTQSQYFASLSGDQTAGILIGGDGSHTTNVQNYDGTSWTNGTALIKAVSGQSTAGGQTAATSALGYSAGATPDNNYTDTFTWDGTGWTSVSPASTGRRNLTGFGTSGSMVAVAGYTTGGSNNVEEFTGEIQTATASTLTTS